MTEENKKKYINILKVMFPKEFEELEQQKMTEFLKKVLVLILYCVGFPIMVVIFGVFLWASCLIDFMNDQEIKKNEREKIFWKASRK